MNRQQFNSRNNIGQVLTFQKSGATNSFDPFLTMGISRRASWRFDNGLETVQIAGNSIIYTGFTSDFLVRDIELRVGALKTITQILMDNDNIYGNFDATKLTSLIYFSIFGNTNLTGITHSSSVQNFNNYLAYDCNLTGNLDLTPLSGLGGDLRIFGNSQLTGITHSPSPNNFSVYLVNSCNLTGNLNLPFSGLGGSFWVYTNPNLTGITHSPSSQVFTSYLAYNCNLTGNLDLTPLSGLGGSISFNSNPNLTGITHVQSTQDINSYSVFSCNLTGNLDLPFSGLGGNFSVRGNPNLTGLTHAETLRSFSSYLAYSCDLTGTLDITNLKNFGGELVAPCYMNVSNNTNLTNILYPTTSNFFRNSSNFENLGSFVLYSCNLDYVDFKPLSGATLLTGTTQGNPRISLRDNNMSAGDVNHILVDFSGNTTVNPAGWSNVNLNIGGSNADPDSSSGGYDGLAAIAFLTGSPYNWTITY